MPRSFEPGFKVRLRAEHEKADRGWEPVGVGLLKESFSEHALHRPGTPSVTTSAWCGA